MARPEMAALLTLAESIADGSAVDWEAIEAGAPAHDRGVIRQLRVLSSLAGLHRTLPPEAGQAMAAVDGQSATPAIGSWAHLVLRERLGGGAFADVFRAWDRHLEREVALKLLKFDEAVDDPRTSRIATEGRLLARVRHPNVIVVHGVAVHDQRVGLWMDLVRGVTLEQQLAAQGPFSAREAALIGIDLCRALAAIHAAGLIHRDIKAQNVMREDGGRIVLMDLGTGREAGPESGRRGPELAGTPLYLAPEIFTGTSASPSTDLYSLGVLLYHLVSGSFPVKVTTLKELHQAHARAKYVRLRDARADLPTPFVRVIERAVAADPTRRYTTAGELEADLLDALDRGTAVAVPEAPDERANVRGFGWPRAGVIAAVLTALFIVGAIGWPMLGRRTAPASSPVVAPGTIRSIAVLPLVNLSGDPSQEYFADGMTDELIGTLGQLGGVKVISRTSAMQFKGTKQPLPQIARALQVDAVLEGSVNVLASGSSTAAGTAGKQIRINARLIYAGSDTQIWDRTFETVASDVFTLQRDVAKAVVDGIGLSLTSQREQVLDRNVGGQATPQHLDAFDLYLRGRYYWNVRTEEGIKRSVQYFQEAIARDPGYALAYSGLADAYNVLAQYGFAPWRDSLDRAREAATKALSLDDSVAEAHVSLAFIHNQQLEWSAAESEFKRAIALKPAYAVAHHWYANCLMQLGRFPEALAEIDKAAQLDPLSIAVSGARGSILLVARRYDEAVGQMGKTIQMDPSVSRAHMILGEAYAQKGEFDQALDEMNRAQTLQASESVSLTADKGYVLAAAGRREEALKIVGDLTRLYEQKAEGAAGGLGIVYAGLSDTDHAFEWLERARQIADPMLPDLKTDPRLDRVRTDPRFGKLLASAGFAQ